jgi:hypothetical protein
MSSTQDYTTGEGSSAKRKFFAIPQDGKCRGNAYVAPTPYTVDRTPLTVFFIELSKKRRTFVFQ